MYVMHTVHVVLKGVFYLKKKLKMQFIKIW